MTTTQNTADLGYDGPEPGFWAGALDIMTRYPDSRLDQGYYDAAERLDPELGSLRRQIRQIREQAEARWTPGTLAEDDDPNDPLAGLWPGDERTDKEKAHVTELWTAYDARFPVFVAEQAAQGH